MNKGSGGVVQCEDVTLPVWTVKPAVCVSSSPSFLQFSGLFTREKKLNHLSFPSPVDGSMFVCFDRRLFTPESTPKGVDFCVHGRLYSRLKGSRAPTSGSAKCLILT